MELHRWTRYFFLFAAVVGLLLSDEVPDDTDFKYHSFQVEARAGKSECFYQYFSYNTSLTLLWHVVGSSGGGQLAASVTLTKEPDMTVLYESPYGQMGDHKENNVESTYEICISNELGYTSKTVYLWIDYQTKRTWDGVVSQDDALQHYQLKRDLVRDILRNLEGRLHDMTFHQTVYRQNTFADEAALSSLSDIVNHRSMFSSSVIIISAIIQVVFLKKLFSLPKTTSNSSI
ncbi:transmembrane emp24 domain-containing protein 1-like isoform X2 [Watersipora subatra]|uniref:transmembrane emp24 domain-containing protein 1-like isoform X2 n=1 Tax=Watersipora subatra TaxID=2589382 RepID=UPI00355C4185